MLPPNGQEVKSDPNGHGTCMVDRVVGFKNGVAKNTDIVIVKMPSSPGGSVQFDARNVLEALNQIAEDIYIHKTLGKAVVNLSMGMYKPSSISAVTETLVAKLTSGKVFPPQRSVPLLTPLKALSNR